MRGILTFKDKTVYIHIMASKIDKKQLMSCADCLCFNVRKASRIITQIYDEHMSETGLRGTQFTIIVMITINESLTINKLAEALVMDRTTLTRNLKPLEKQGLIEIFPGVDRRTRAVRLTPLGFKTLKKALPLWQQAQDLVNKKLGQQRFDHLLKELRAVKKLIE